MMPPYVILYFRPHTLIGDMRFLKVVDWPIEFLYFPIMNIVRNIQTEILASDWAMLKKVTYEYRKEDGEWETQTREAYDRGNGVTILLYHPQKKTVLLIRQFRIPTFLNGNPDGHLIETPAGKLEDESPEGCIKREVLEETGYSIQDVEKIFEAYMSPGSVTELIHFYFAEYQDEMKVNNGGGNGQEQENIQVLEIPLYEALGMMKTGEIKDAKTIMLLQYAQNMRLL